MGTVFSSSEEDEEEELEQEPEVPPFEHSSSPLSPQISMSRSPFFGPSMRTSDPFNAITPVSLSPTNAHVSHHLSRFHSVGTSISPGPFLPSWLLAAEEFQTEVYLIRHGQSTANLRPELISGRSASATLTETGKREARALGVFLRSTGVAFDAVYTSSLERAKQTAVITCQGLSILEEQVEVLDAVQELSQGQWEGRVRTDVYTKDIIQIMNNSQPDFRAPGGESQRQVEFRMVEFLNNVILPNAAIALQEEAKMDKDKVNVTPNLSMQIHPLEKLEATSTTDPKILDESNAKGDDIAAKTTSIDIDTQPASNDVDAKTASSEIKQLEHKSESNGGDRHKEEDIVHQDHMPEGRKLTINVTRREPEPPRKRGPYRVAVFSHSMAIKCALRGLLGSDPLRTQRICIDTTSMSVLRHAGSTGWQVQRLNDTSHLRLL